MDHRIYVKHVNPDTLEICSEDDPEAVAFDRVSSKETARGRVDRLVAALNCAISLTPDQRLVSLGTRLEVRPANGQYHDQGLDSVSEFQAAFGQYVATKPELPTISDECEESLKARHKEMAAMGEKLKKDAAWFKEWGDVWGALLFIRLQLCQEELAELAEAMLERDIIGCLDALTDMTYVADGTYLTLGLGHYKLAALAEVHSSNMSKLGEDGKPIISEAGRVVKGPNYRRPDLKSVLGL